MTQNPDPTLKITSLKGVTRTLDDWTTMFHVCLVVLPDRPEGAAWVPIARRIFKVLGDADCRAAVCVAGSEHIARRVVGTGADEFVVFTEIFQRARQRVGSVGLGGNGQFARLTALMSLGDAPWTKCLTEDLDHVRHHVRARRLADRDHADDGAHVLLS